MVERYRANFAASAAAAPAEEGYTACDIALGYLRRGWQPVPVPHGEKKPNLTDWPSLRVTEANVAEYFGRGGNVGVLLGAASGGLTDVDLDCPEALALADVFLPDTTAIFGRHSKRRSHRLYVTQLHAS